MRLLTVILMMLSVSLSAAELSSSAERAVENFNEDLAEAVEDFEEAKQDALTRLTRTMDRERSRALRDGDTELVALIDAQIEAATTELQTAGQMTDFIGQPVAVHSVTARQAEAIVRALPTFTVEQWDSAPGLEFTVQASQVLETGVVIKSTDRYIIIPHPTDTWRNHTDDTLRPENQKQFSWQGNEVKTQEHNKWTQLAWVLGSSHIDNMVGITVVSASAIVVNTQESEQMLNLRMRDPHIGDCVGSIRVKIIGVE